MEVSLDEKRQQISDLRTEMHAVENQMRLQIAHDLDLSEIAGRLINMRKELVQLIKQRDQLGGGEVLLPYKERVFAAANATSIENR